MEWLVAGAAAVSAFVGFLGWWREKNKDKSTAENARFALLFDTYQQLLMDSGAAREATNRLREECEQREVKLKAEMKLMSIRLDALEGALKDG